MTEKQFNKVFNSFILAGMFIAVAVLNSRQFSQSGARPFWLCLATLGALSGVVNVVLSAKGSIWNYLFGLVDVLAMTAVCLESSIGSSNPMWGVFIMHAAFLLPMQFVGIWQWRKHGATSKKQVRARRLSAGRWLLMAGGMILSVPLLYLAERSFGLHLFSVSSSQEMMVTLFGADVNIVILLEVSVVAISVFAQILMTMAIADQWVLWICVNVLSVLLFFFKSRSSEPDSYTIVYMVKYIFYFINSLNGLRIWLKLSREK